MARFRGIPPVQRASDPGQQIRLWYSVKRFGTSWRVHTGQRGIRFSVIFRVVHPLLSNLTLRPAGVRGWSVSGRPVGLVGPDVRSPLVRLVLLAPPPPPNSRVVKLEGQWW